MKKRGFLKRIVALGMSVMFCFGCVNSVYAADNLLVDCSEVGEVVTAAESELIEDKLEEVGALKLEIAKLKEQIKYAPAKSYSRVNEIKKERNSS